MGGDINEVTEERCDRLGAELGALQAAWKTAEAALAGLMTVVKATNGIDQAKAAASLQDYIDDLTSYVIDQVMPAVEIAADPARIAERVSDEVG